jgi:predicted nucleotidyltransferase
MEVIYTTLVGSKMHGLSTPTSDEDVRHITMHPIRHILSPFRNEEIKVKDSAGDDVESWELCHFVKHLTQGNPTTYEVIRSPLYDKSMPHAEAIRSLMPLCFDGRKVLMAHIGYTEAQLKRYLRKADHDLNAHVSFTGDYNLLGVPKWETKDGKLVIDGTW